MISQRRRRSVGLTNASLRRENQNFLLPPARSLPAHADVLHPAEEISTVAFRQIIARDWKFPLSSFSPSDDFVDPFLTRFQDVTHSVKTPSTRRAMPSGLASCKAGGKRASGTP